MRIRYLRPRWRGTLLSGVGLIGCLSILQFTEMSSLYESRWLMAFFAIGMFGGLLALFDSVALFLKEWRK